MITIYRALVPGLQRGVRYGVALLLAVAVSTLAVHHVNAVHTARQAVQEKCAAKLEALKSRNTYLAKYVEPADKCLALSLLTGDPK